MRAILGGIDSISEWAGKTVRWFCAVIVLIITYEVIGRYIFNATQVWAYETSMMLGITVYAWAWAYVQKNNAHIRVDVIYARLSPRGKAAIDAVSILLFFPLIIQLIDSSISWAWRAWLINEKMIEGIWFPPAAPVRTVVALGFCTFALQVGARFLRDLYMLIKNKAYD